MKFLRYVFVALALLALISFVSEETARSSSEGLLSGNTAPQIILSDTATPLNLGDYEGQYVLVNFWAAYDAGSRAKNVSLWNGLKKMGRNDVTMVSVSFDDYKSVYEETVKIDGIDMGSQLYEPTGENSQLFEKYQLQKGFTCYLLDKSGRIIAKGISADNLETLLMN